MRDLQAIDEDRLFGTLAIELKLAAAEQVDRALAEQSRRRAVGETVQLGAILVRDGVLSPEHVVQLLDLQGKALLRCASCGTTYNALGYEPTQGGACPRCGGPLGAPSLHETQGGVSAADTLRLAPRLSPHETVVVPDRDPGMRTESAPHPAPPAADAGVPFGRYRLLERLGSGNMGVVWRAWDPELKRVVALKLIKEDPGPRTIERFQREARVAARLRHPGIAAVHDVGQADGRHYITMDFIEGRTFESFLAPRRAAKRAGERAGLERLEEEVLLLAQVAEAVAYAHAQGIVHRDLKPGNVLIDGAGRATVTDFGVAKELVSRDGTSITIDGQLVGTPAYMSPEQAAGDHERIRAGSDVWALGVILYEVLTGWTPFEGVGHPLEILVAVGREEPRRPSARNPQAPVALEAVCLKALEKDPARRYVDAGSFALELARWRRGEPVEARAPGRLERWWRAAMRRPAWVAAAAGLLLALASGAVALREHAGARGLREEVLAQLRDNARTYVEETLLARRRGDLAAGRRFRVRLEQASRQAREQLREPTGEPEYHLGRLLRALLDDEEALAAQDRALSVQADFAPSLYERAVLCARRYRAELERARQVVRANRGEGLREAVRTDAAAAAPVAEPTVADLERIDAGLRRWKGETVDALARLRDVLDREPGWREHPVDLLRVTAARVVCVEGMLSAYGGEAGWDESRRRLEAAIAADPGLEEAYEALTHAALAAGRWPEAVTACTRGIETDRGYLPHWLNRGEARAAWARHLQTEGGDPVPLWLEAEADLGEALSLEPACLDARVQRGRVRGHRALHAWSRGGDPLPLLHAAIEDYTGAAEQAPDRADVWLRRGAVRLDAAVYRGERGEETAELYQAAIDDLARALETDPDLVEAWSRRGAARMHWGKSDSRRGADPTARYGAAVADADEALRREPDSAQALVTRGLARMYAGEFHLVRGGNAAGELAAAEADLRRAAERRPEWLLVHLSLGAVRMFLGTLRAQGGEDAAGVYAAAEEAYGRALELDARSADAWASRGMARFSRAVLLGREGIGPDATGVFAGAMADLARAVECNPSGARIWLSRAAARMNWGLLTESHGGDPGPLFAEAVEDYGRSLALHPGEAESWRGRGVARFELGRRLERDGKPGAPVLDAALADLEMSVTLNPRQPDARELLEGLLGKVAGRSRTAGLLRAGDAEVAAGRYAAARRLYAEGLRRIAGGEEAGVDREALVRARYNAACVESLAAAGMNGPDAPPRPLEEAAARTRRDAAFAHLQKAVELGWRDRDHLEKDPDLAPLRDDARWRALLASLGK